MKPPTLGRCSSCACFIRLTEAACPFCGKAVSRWPRAARPPQLKPSLPTTLGMRLRQSAVWAFGASTLALAPACGGVTVAGGDDASTETAADKEAGTGDEPEAVDAADEQVADAASTDAGTDDAMRERDAHRCDVFIGVDYGAAPCQ